MHVEKLGEELKGNLSQHLSQILLCFIVFLNINESGLQSLWKDKNLSKQIYIHSTTLQRVMKHVLKVYMMLLKA